jgi:wobble nucleotide-excising tRNase
MTGLASKRDKAFESITTDTKAPVPDQMAFQNAIKRLNELINAHNQRSSDFEGARRETRKELEHCYVAESLQEFEDKERAIKDKQTDLDKLKSDASAINTDITELERDIIEHRRPAEELNADLISYLAHDDLQLTIRDTGYILMRGGVPATNLSEGEKTAFAFLYFLKSLQDKNLKLADSIVVIDDPVSSLDTNSLFSAFAFMKERAKDAGQLFILTHNFGFFRQVKNWFHHLPKQRSPNIAVHPARFYMLESQYDGQGRGADVTGEFCTRANVRETGTRGAEAWPGRSTVQNRSSPCCDRSKSN